MFFSLPMLSLGPENEAINKWRKGGFILMSIWLLICPWSIDSGARSLRIISKFLWHSILCCVAYVAQWVYVRTLGWNVSSIPLKKIKKKKSDMKFFLCWESWIIFLYNLIPNMVTWLKTSLYFCGLSFRTPQISIGYVLDKCLKNVP